MVHCWDTVGHSPCHDTITALISSVGEPGAGSRGPGGRGAGEPGDFRDLLLFPWVGFHDRPGRGGQSPPRVRVAMAISASGEW